MAGRIRRALERALTTGADQAPICVFVGPHELVADAVGILEGAAIATSVEGATYGRRSTGGAVLVAPSDAERARRLLAELTALVDRIARELDDDPLEPEDVVVVGSYGSMVAAEQASQALAATGIASLIVIEDPDDTTRAVQLGVAPGDRSAARARLLERGLA